MMTDIARQALADILDEIKDKTVNHNLIMSISKVRRIAHDALEHPAYKSTGMNTIEYWEVNESYDRDMTAIANFTNEEEAKKLAGGSMYRGVWKKSFTFFDTVEDYENNTREKLRERALAKLTIEERQALGLI